MRRFLLVMLSLVVVGSLTGVGVSLAAKTTPPITYTPQRINFGRVAVGDTSPAVTITFTNTLLYPVYAEAPAISPPFEVVSGTCEQPVAAEGGTCTEQVVFKPTSKGHYRTQAAFVWHQAPLVIVDTSIVKLAGGAY